jgi:hypothetical protein
MGFRVVSALAPPSGADPISDVLSIEDVSYSGSEGTTVVIRARRTFGGSSALAAAASVDWQITGLTEGAPTTSSGTISWAAGEVGLKTVSLLLGLVTQTRNGTLALSNPRYTSGGTATPSLTSASVTFTVVDTLTPTQPIEQPLSQFTPTHYVSATASGTGDGLTRETAFTLPQALAAAQPGWRVMVLAGTYVGPNRNNRFTATFQIANAGTQANPIIFFAENYAATNSVGRTILQHTGTVQGSGCPVLGLSTGHWWYGPYINEDQAPSTPDTGPVVVGGQYTRIGYARINRGGSSWPQAENNQAAIRYEGIACRNHLVHDCWIENYDGIGSNGSQQAIQLFSVNNNAAQTTGLITVEHCYFDNNQFALTSKGAGFTRPIHGGIVFRYNMVRTSNRGNSGGVNFMDTSGELGRNQVYGNVFVGGNCAVRTMIQADYPCRDIDVVNNTAINLTNTDDYYGLHADTGQVALGSGWRIHNNVNVGTLAPLFRSPYTEGADIAIQSRSHNISQASVWLNYAYRGGNMTLSQSVAASAWDDNSINANASLQSTTWGNANLGKLAAGSPAFGAGIDVLNLLGGGTSAPINMGAFYQSGQTDVIGIRPVTPPAIFTPTHYVSATASGTGDGLTRETAYTFDQAKANAAQGRRYMLLAGVYTKAPSGSGTIGPFDLTTAGTAANPIIWFAESYASISATGRTEFRHTGLYPNGCPTLSIRAPYNEVYGVFFDEAQANPGVDTGTLQIAGHHITVGYCEFNRRAIDTWVPSAGNTGSNLGAIRIEPGQDIRIANNKFLNYTAATSVPYGHTCIFLFSSTGGGTSDTRRITIEHNEFDNCNVFIYFKGAGGVRPMRGGMTVRYNKGRLTTRPDIVNNYFCNLGDCDDTDGPNRFYGNVVAGGTLFVRPQFQSDEGGRIEVRSVHIYNNTVMNVANYSETAWLGCANSVGNQLDRSSWRVHNNIYANQNAGGGRVYAVLYNGNGPGDNSFQTANHNTFFNHSSFSYVDGIGAETRAQLNARTGREANSNERNPLIASYVYGDPNFGELQSGSNELSAGVDLFQLLGGSASASINRGAYHPGLPRPGITPLT